MDDFPPWWAMVDAWWAWWMHGMVGHCGCQGMVGHGGCVVGHCGCMVWWAIVDVRAWWAMVDAWWAIVDAWYGGPWNFNVTLKRKPRWAISPRNGCDPQRKITASKKNDFPLPRFMGPINRGSIKYRWLSIWEAMNLCHLGCIKIPVNRIWWYSKRADKYAWSKYPWSCEQTLLLQINLFNQWWKKVSGRPQRKIPLPPVVGPTNYAKKVMFLHYFV